MLNICIKYGFVTSIISGSYGGHRRHKMYDGRRTTPWVWHKLPTGELKIFLSKIMSVLIAGHSQVKYLNQYTQDPHVSCFARPGGQIRYFFPNK